METITLQIGNTDDTLSQEEWSDFCHAIDLAVREAAAKLHFFGGPPTHARKQNACWVFDIEAHDEFAGHAELRAIVARTRALYGQESIAWTSGRTEFL